MKTITTLIASLFLLPSALAQDFSASLALACLARNACLLRESGPEINKADAEKFIFESKQDLKTLRLEGGQPPLHFVLAVIDAELSMEKRTQAYSVADRLLKAGCDIHAKDRHGLTALHNAILFNDLESVRFLLERGADPAYQAGPGRFKGQSAVQFLELLQNNPKSRQPTRTKILKLLNEKSH